MGTYAYDQEWQDERERLAGMEALWNEGSQAVLERAGVGPGWRCLEVGAGGGAMTEWLSEQVGSDGHVVAADVSLRFLSAIDRPNVEVLEVDALRGELPGGFDLAYARLVAEHLGPPLVAAMAGTLRPGGLLVLEDYDFDASGTFPVDADFDRIGDSVVDLMSTFGFDPLFGRRLVGELEAAGLEDVGAEGRARVFRGGTPFTAFYRFTMMAMREPLIASGRLTPEDLDRGLARLDDPAVTFVSPLMVAAWGRRR